MILCDGNVLIYAFRSYAEGHPRYKAWLESAINGPVANVVRICTHRRIFARPSSLDDAFEFCRVVLEQPVAPVITPGEHYWSIFESLSQDAKATGNIAQDAWFAALAIESGCEWIITDRDYSRFKGLTWRSPL